jgi:hypothetical protein
MRIKPNDLAVLKAGARKQAQTFIIGSAVSRVKRTEEGNRPVGLKSQSSLCQRSDPLPMSLSQQPHPP